MPGPVPGFFLCVGERWLQDPEHRAQNRLAVYERIVTQDGSITYRNEEVGVTYRSLHGAESESRYVFLRGTRLTQRPSPWRVLELGFGSGLNFAVTLQAAQEAGVELHYTTLEPSPMPSDMWLVPEEWKQAPLDQSYCLDRVQLRVLQKRWQDWEPEHDHYHAVYHDPFGPGPAPECWESDCFSWSYRALSSDGVLATFGASSSARHAMKEAGFLVGTERGAGKKREMTVASKCADIISEAWPWKRK